MYKRQTYYRQLNQIVGRNTIAEAKKRMTKKFGKELATRWENFFKLYVQGAMGQPDVIPDYIYNDPKMKIQGTPYAWFADNKVRDRVNSIRKSLGIEKKNMPKELSEYSYEDVRAWSNLEAQFELAALLAHPKSAVTNLFGGSLHTIQSAGPNALRKARNIKWLKRINPEWNSMEDVTDFVVKKGVVPEFMIHELGLGREAIGTKSIENFTFNIAVASIRTLFNKLSSYKALTDDDNSILLFVTNKLLIMINPMVPHIAEELWETLNNEGMICYADWPVVNEVFLENNNVKIPIQVNGKMRAVIEVPSDVNKEDLEKLALSEKNVLKFLSGKPKKSIIIPNRIVNFVT